MMPLHRKRRNAGFLAIASYVAVLWSGALGAAVVDDLYSVAVEPQPGARETRLEIIQRGMQQLLIRVTGRDGAATHEDLSPIVERAERYINRYGLSPDGRSYLVGFRAGDVNAELTARDWPIWGAERPLTLFWIAIEGPTGVRAVLSEAGSGEGLSRSMRQALDGLREELERVAELRGLPILVPTIDPEDPWAVTAEDIWDGLYERIELASSLHGADAYFVAALDAGASGIGAQWSLMRDGRQTVIYANGVQDAVNWLANEFAAEYSFVGGARNLRLVVENVDSLEDYGRVMSYLESLSVLDAVEVDELDGSRLALDLRSRGSEEVLARVLTLDGFLRPVARPEFDPEEAFVPPFDGGEGALPDAASAIGNARAVDGVAAETGSASEDTSSPLIYSVPRGGF